MDTDLLIVGGGPAGLATAILAAEKGLSVVVADSAIPPIDKACGEGLMPDAVAALDSLGIKFTVAESSAFRGIRFRSPHVAPAHSPDVEAAFLRGPGISVRRLALHEALSRRASLVGVNLRWGARVTEIHADTTFAQVTCNGQRIRSRWVAGADGENSQVRRALGQHVRPRYERIRFGYRQHFEIVPWTDFVEVYWAKSCQIVAAPLGSQEVCIAVTSRDPHMKIAAALREVPELAARMHGAAPRSQGRGARVALRRLRAVHYRTCALIGDASGSVDPVTGEGLGLAFHQAAALVDALAGGHLTGYQAAHDRVSRVPRLMSRLILAMDAHPFLRDRALLALAAEPQLFSRLLHTHIQAITASEFGLCSVLRLGWRMVIGAREPRTA